MKHFYERNDFIGMKFKIQDKKKVIKELKTQFLKFKFHSIYVLLEVIKNVTLFYETLFIDPVKQVSLKIIEFLIPDYHKADFTSCSE